MGAAWSGETEPRVKGQSFWDQRRAHSNLDFNSCPSLASLPTFPSSQPQAFHRGNLSAETEGSEEQVVTGMFADRHFSERGCFARLPHLQAR